MIEQYGTFHTKVCPDELILCNFNEQPIPSDYYNFLNDENYDGNNVTSTPVDNTLQDNKLLEDPVMPNDEDINN